MAVMMMLLLMMMMINDDKLWRKPNHDALELLKNLFCEVQAQQAAKDMEAVFSIPVKDLSTHERIEAEKVQQCASAIRIDSISNFLPTQIII
jgi:hypothetical protein